MPINIDKLNVRTLKEYLKNKNSKSKSKSKKTKPKKKIKNLSQKATVSFIAFLGVVDWQVSLFIFVNLLFYTYYKYFCKMIDQRKAKRIEKMKKYEDKDEGVKKRMKNLKQFKA